MSRLNILLMKSPLFQPLRRVILPSWLLLLGMTCSVSARSEGQQPGISREQPFLESKIRAAFWGGYGLEQDSERQLQFVRQHGFNTALINESRWSVDDAFWTTWAQLAEQYQLFLFPIYSFAGTDEKRVWRESLVPYVTRTGETLNATPCPLDPNYWERSIGQRFRQLAQIATTVKITGLLFDTEMYGSEIAIYSDYCFCDACWLHFLDAARITNAGQVLKEQRYPYLLEHQLFQTYGRFQERRVQEIVSALRDDLHTIQPELFLGFLAYRNTWFYRSLIRGLGTLTRPVLVFSELTYVRGYTPSVDAEQATLTRDVQTVPQSNFRYIPGLWLGRFFPDDVPSQAYSLATHADGYWIFTADSLWKEEPQPEPYALHGQPQAYWQALQQANTAIYSVVTDVNTQPPALPPIYGASFYDIERRRLSTQPGVHDVLLDSAGRGVSGRTNESSSVSSSTREMFYRGRSLFHLLNTAEGEIQIRGRAFAASLPGIVYQLFDHEGQLLSEGEIDLQGRSPRIPIPAGSSQVLSLLVDSGDHIIQISFAKIPYIIEASGTFPLTLLTVPQSFSVYRSAETRWMKLRAYCSDTQARMRITITSPDGETHSSAEGREFTEIRTPLSRLAAKHPIWQVTITPSSPQSSEKEVLLYFYDDAFPYVIPNDRKHPSK